MELHRIVAPDASKATAESPTALRPRGTRHLHPAPKNSRTEVIVATEETEHAGGLDPSNSAAEPFQDRESEAQGGKAFKPLSKPNRDA